MGRPRSAVSPRRPRTGNVRPTGPLELGIYWLTPLLLTGVLAWLGALSQHAIRHEELVESVRNVLWLDDRLLYDGIYSNVGWYATLLGAYKVFGFSLATAKYVRVGLHLIGLLAVAALLVRAMQPRHALVPLVAIGLSPTLLYFGTLQTSFGLDMPFAAMALYLISHVRPSGGSSGPRDLVLSLALGAIASFAAMTYPAFLLYLPSLALVFVWQAGRSAPGGLSSSWLLTQGVAASLGFALPVVSALLYLETPELLVFDPVTGGGLFRAGGQIGFDAGAFARALGLLASDLFVQGRSYYFDVTRPDFSGVLAPAGLAATLATFAWLTWTNRISPWIAAALGLALTLGVVVPSLSVDGEPGLRRSTVVISGCLAAFAISWHALATARTTPWRWRALAVAGCALLPLGYATKVPSLAADLAGSNPYQNRDWFAMAGSPAASLAKLSMAVEQGQQVACPVASDFRVSPCRYQEVYAALAGHRRWNGLPPRDIHALDWRTGEDIVLSTALWREGYYPTCSRADVCARDMEAIFAAMRERGGR